MELTPSAHLDTFARDGLPPPERWPRLVFELPELTYPDRLNCGAELLDRTVERFGTDRPAFHDGEGLVWSYGELQDRVDRIAHVLTTDLRVRPGNRVLLRGPTTPWLAACWLAVMKAGAVAVTVLAQQRAPELAVMADAARCTHALCDAHSLDELLAARIPGLRVTPFGGDGPEDLLALAARRPGPYEAVATAADDVALIAFTSGTTGQPKGCVHFHRDVLAVADTFSAHVLRPLPDDVFAGSPPLAFTFGLGGLVVFPLRAGASAVLLEQAGPKQLLAAIERHRVSVLFTAPTAYRVMLDELGAGAAPDITSLRRCVSAGENLPEATWTAWYGRTGLRLINGIGATELLHIFISAADGDIRPGTTGRPVPGWQARIVDRDGKEVPDGEEGLLAVRGPVGCRYLADPRQAEYVRDGWNVTGDTYVRRPDGWFRYVSRADDMIISAGYNIAGPQVEEVLLDHPDVVETAVVGRPDELRGQVVVAYTVVRDGVPRDSVTAAALRAFVRARLAPYKSPREIVFLDALPRTATGKLQRFRLRDPV
ncbi:2-aminobenzoate-CoA ligase [Streptomyces sp. Root431]|uniref:AMP-binding protein n=1 Tax=Streptomyces sp. Root431 TaxID=1736535 RepID=UPI0006FB5832|nr:AMP-binding protein [Streptomyces sp. Root431]KQX12682.1 2-aminobenzoate-CoA ligase [Streptomyces sp. Root431]